MLLPCCTCGQPTANAIAVNITNKEGKTVSAFAINVCEADQTEVVSHLCVLPMAFQKQTNRRFIVY